jgi:hypothetical protein
MSLLFNQYRRDEPFVISSKTIEDGLNVGDAEKICAATFKNEIAQLTLEIASPRVLEVIHVVRVTFPDMLGTIGNDRIYIYKYISQQHYSCIYKFSIAIRILIKLWVFS